MISGLGRRLTPSPAPTPRRRTPGPAAPGWRAGSRITSKGFDRRGTGANPAGTGRRCFEKHGHARLVQASPLTHEMARKPLRHADAAAREETSPLQEDSLKDGRRPLAQPPRLESW